MFLAVLCAYFSTFVWSFLEQNEQETIIANNSNNMMFRKKSLFRCHTFMTPKEVGSKKMVIGKKYYTFIVYSTNYEAIFIIFFFNDFAFETVFFLSCCFLNCLFYSFRFDTFLDLSRFAFGFFSCFRFRLWFWFFFLAFWSLFGLFSLLFPSFLFLFLSFLFLLSLTSPSSKKYKIR